MGISLSSENRTLDVRTSAWTAANEKGRSAAQRGTGALMTCRHSIAVTQYKRGDGELSCEEPFLSFDATEVSEQSIWSHMATLSLKRVQSEIWKVVSQFFPGMFRHLWTGKRYIIG